MGIKFANLASTTLASGVNATATSITVTSASSFPTLGSGDYFYASIGFGSDSEIVKVTAVAGDIFTVVRAQDDTSASAHASGEEIALRVTAKALEDINESANQTITLSGDVTGSGTDTISVSVSNDSHTHAFNNLTGKEQGTGTYSTAGHIEAGRGNGGVALTHNDGYGNASVTFNHRSGSPEQTGNAGRIEVNTDRANDADVFMSFEGKSAVTADTATALETMMELRVGAVKIPYKIEHIGDSDTFIAMENDKVYIRTGNQMKWNSNDWTSNTEASAEFTFAGGLKTDEITASSTSQSGGQQQLVLNAGESQGKVVDGNGDSTQTDEFVYINAEKGLSVNTPDSNHSNWDAGYDVETTIIKGSSITVDGNTVWHAGNDGSGSGLDADKLDNLDSDAFLRSNVADTMTNILTFESDNPQPIVIRRTSTANAGIVFANEDSGGNIVDRTYFGLGNEDGELMVGTAADVRGQGNVIWHEGNDGAESGLDADKLDGKHASEFPLVANGTVASDFNNYTTAGNYFVSNWNPSGGTQISNGPTYTFNTNETETAYGWGMLRVSNFNPDNDNFIVQEYIAHQYEGIWIRVYWNGNWTAWRQQYTNSSDGNTSGLNADTLDGQEGSYYLDYNNFSNKPTIPSISGLASETYVNNAVAGLVDSAPDALNTLNELAAAINDDSTFNDTITTLIGTKLAKTGGTLTGNLSIESSDPHLILKDTSDNDDFKIKFLSNNGTQQSAIEGITSVSGSAEDAFVFNSIHDHIFIHNDAEELRIKDGGVDVAGDLDVAEYVYGKAFRAEPAAASHAILSVLKNGSYQTVIDGDKDINCRNLDVDGTFTVGSSSNYQTMTFTTGTASSDPAILHISSVIESNTAQGDVYSALHFGVLGAETGGGNLTDGTIAAVKAIDCRSGSTSYEDGGLGFYTTDHDDSNHKLRGYFGNSGGLHLTDDEGIEDNIAAGSLKVDGTINSGAVTATTLRLTGTGDAAPSSTGHALQVGATNGGNIIVDTNEIMARNNGSASAIHINADGGDITFRNNQSGTTNLAMSGTVFMDHSRNLTNIGTISSGAITTSDHISLPDSKYLRLGNDNDFIIYHDGTSNYLQTVKQDSDLIIRGNDGGTNFNALTIDMSAGGNATFVADVLAQSFTLTNGGDRSITGPQNEDLIINARPNDATEGLHLRINGTDKLFINQAGNATLAGALTISGNLTASGTTTTLGTSGEDDVLIDCLCTDDIFIKQNGTNRALFNSAGITSYGNVYTASTSSFRNYGGVWKATTGTTGNGFEFNSADGTAATLSSTGELEIFGDLLMQDQKKLYLSTDTTTAPTYFHTNSDGHLELYLEGQKSFEMYIQGNSTYFNLEGALITTANIVSNGGSVEGSYFRASSHASIVRIVNSSWDANQQAHDIIYNSTLSNLGDFVYIKAAGNGTSNHGIGVFADNVFAVGTIDQNTGTISNSTTAPIDDTWMYVNSSGLTVDGSVNTGNGGVTTGLHGDSGDWYQAVLDSASALSRTATTGQTVASQLTLNGDVKLNDGLYIEVPSSDYTPPLRVERNGGTGATLGVIETTGTYASSLTFRTFYSGFTMHNQHYTGFVFQNGYIAPSANLMGYLGDGTVHLGSSTYAWGNIYTQDCLYTQEDGAGLTAPRKAFSCRAWAVIRQTSTQAILKDQGVSSITDLGTGLTRVTFDSSFPDQNYAVTANGQIDDLSGDANDVSSVGIKNKFTTYVELANEDVDDVFTDSPNLSVVIHR